MSRTVKITLILAGFFAVAQPLLGAQRFVRRVPPVIVVQPHYGFAPAWHYGWHDPWWNRPTYVVPPSNTGEVKIDTHMKDALVYVDGGYAGVSGKLKHFDLRPGNHDIELRDSSGRTIYHQRVQVILDKTTEIHLDA